MSKVDTRVLLDAAVLGQVDDLARAEGRTREQVIEDSVRRTVAVKTMREVLARASATTLLGDTDAEVVAYDEVRAARAARPTPTSDGGSR